MLALHRTRNDKKVDSRVVVVLSIIFRICHTEYICSDCGVYFCRSNAESFTDEEQSSEKRIGLGFS